MYLEYFSTFNCEEEEEEECNCVSLGEAVGESIMSYAYIKSE
jgi:hypothetical protein